jgi:hypothetical protein
MRKSCLVVLLLASVGFLAGCPGQKTVVHDGGPLLDDVTKYLFGSKASIAESSKLSESLKNLSGAAEQRFTAQQLARRTATLEMTAAVEHWASTQAPAAASSARSVSERNILRSVTVTFTDALSDIADDAATGLACVAIRDGAFASQDNELPDTADYYWNKSGSELVTAAENVLSKTFTGPLGPFVNWLNWANGVQETANSVLTSLRNSPGSYQIALANPITYRAAYAYAKFCLKPPVAL